MLRRRIIIKIHWLPIKIPPFTSKTTYSAFLCEFRVMNIAQEMITVQIMQSVLSILSALKVSPSSGGWPKWVLFKCATEN